MKGKKTEKKKNGSEVVNFSALCESRNAKMRCNGCRVRWYCSKECQKLHWKRGGHKQECQALLRLLQKKLSLEWPVGEYFKVFDYII